MAANKSGLEELRKGIARMGEKALAKFQRQRADVQGKSIAEIGGILGRKLGAHLQKKPRKPEL
jgi:hypothetical protein